jgi:hypothetical protein
MTNCPIESSQRRKLIFFTVVYVLLFPFLFYMALLSSMVSDSPRITPFFVGVIMMIVFSIPLSIPTCIYLMWSRHIRKQYDKARLFSWVPVYVMAVVFILFDVVLHLYHLI